MISDNTLLNLTLGTICLIKIFVEKSTFGFVFMMFDIPEITWKALHNYSKWLKVFSSYLLQMIFFFFFKLYLWHYISSFAL